MSIMVIYKEGHREKFVNISNFIEKERGFSFHQKDEYIFITYDSIMAFSLTGDDKHDTRRM